MIKVASKEDVKTTKEKFLKWRLIFLLFKLGKSRLVFLMRKEKCSVIEAEMRKGK